MKENKCAAVFKIFPLGFRLLLKPGITLPTVLSFTKSSLWMIPLFFLRTLTSDLIAKESLIEVLVEKEGLWIKASGALIYALVWYCLVFHVIDWSARFLGGSPHHRELRWIYFLLMVPEVCFSFLILILDSAGIFASLSVFSGGGLVAYWVIRIWILGVWIYAATRLYGFSTGRVLVMGVLSYNLFVITISILLFLFFFVLFPIMAFFEG